MSSGMIRKYMDLLGGVSKPVQLNENEMVDNSNGELLADMTKQAAEPQVKRFVITPQMLATLEAYAEDGGRIQIDGKTIFAGFGNRSGLHSYLSTVLADSFKKWPRAKAKLEAGVYDTIDVLTFRNINRDRGNWVKVKSFTSASVEPVEEDMAAVKAFRIEGEVRDIVYEKSGKTHGKGYPAQATQMLKDFQDRYPDGFVQSRSTIMPGETATALWDKEGSGAQLVGIWVQSAKYGFMV